MDKGELNPADDIAALAEEVSHGCLSSRELPSRQNWLDRSRIWGIRRVGWTFGIFVASIWTLLELYLLSKSLGWSDASYWHILWVNISATVAGIILFGGLVIWAKGRLEPYRWIFRYLCAGHFAVFLLHLLFLIVIAYARPDRALY
ncbi:MAG: hypothetical protein HN909_03290 [Phycisphaerales bacterium]|jgi:hypothetical protein|nr:hypothetical protein [Phycisphaerales bacterium]MBT7170776.1 hypothetical protein [Phycisphaerales bacterium]